MSDISERPTDKTSRQTFETVSGPLWKTVLFTLGVLAAALFTRVGLIGYPPIYDELYQMLPARSWVDNGTFAVLDGVYYRSHLFTRLIAFAFELTGDQSVATARLIPSALPGALLVAVMFAWTRIVVGPVAGWFVAVFLLLWPNGIEVSQYVRFYALHGLVFAGIALMAHTALTGRMYLRWRLGLLIATLPLIAFANHLQMTTLIGVGAIGLWAALFLLPGWLMRAPWLWLLLGAAIAGAIAILLSGVLTETLTRLWTTYRWEPFPVERDTFFYHRNFRDNYPTFWPLFPVAALIALRAFPRVASFCLTLFAATFVLHSFGGLKGMRYLYPVMPFFFVIWAAALQAVLPGIWAFLQRLCTEALALALPLALPQKISRVLATGVLAISLLFLFGANAAFERSAQMVRGEPAHLLLKKQRWAWPEARERIAPWLEEGALVVTSEELLAVEWLGDYDVSYNRSRFSELHYMAGVQVPPFTIDWRNGRPAIGAFADMARLMACEPVGVFVTNAGWLGGSPIPLRMAEAAQRIGARFTIERGRGVALFGWRHAAGTPAAAGVADGIADGAANGAANGAVSCDALPFSPTDRAATRLGNSS